MVKAHLGRITDDTPEHAGVVVLSMSGLGLVSFTSLESLRSRGLAVGKSKRGSNWKRTEFRRSKSK